MKKKTIILIAMLCAALFILAGCKSIDYGVVIDKSFSPAHNLYQPMIMHVNNHTRIIPRWVHRPDSWAILVENDEGRDWWDVSEYFYNSTEIGDNVDRRKEGVPLSTPAS